MFKNTILPIVLLTFIFSLVEAQPTNTTLRYNWDDNTLPTISGLAYNDIWGYADPQGREYAILGGARHTFFFDITDPDNPVLVDKIDSGQTCVWRDFKTYGHYAYGVADNCSGGLEIFDLSDLPNSVSKVYDSPTFINNAHNIFIDTASHRLYACGINSGVNDLTILDLSSNPSTPSLIRHINLNIGNDYIHDLYVRNDTAYLCNGWARRMLIYDMSDVNNLNDIGNVPSIGYNHSTWLSDDGKVTIVADESRRAPLRLVDISNPDEPNLLSTFESRLLAPADTNSIAHNPYIIENDFAVISYYEDGVQIYKIDRPESPFRAGYHDTQPNVNSYSGDGAWGVYPFLPSGNIIASDIDNGLFIITPNFPLRDCQHDVSVTGIYDNFWDITSSDKISANVTYLASSEVTLYAPDEITLEQGFEILQGGTLSVDIRDECNSAQSLVSQPKKSFQKKTKTP